MIHISEDVEKYQPIYKKKVAQKCVHIYTHTNTHKGTRGIDINDIIKMN